MTILDRALATAGIVAAMLTVPVGAIAQTTPTDDGVLVRVAGDADVAGDEDNAVVVVVEGDLVMDGTAEVVVVVNGDAVFSDARIDTLVVVNGTAALLDGSVVSGDVWAPQSDVTDDGTAEIGGTIRTDVEGLFVGLWVFGLLFALGLGVLGILSALLFVAVAPVTARRATALIRAELGSVVIAGLLFWIVLPLLAVGAFVTVVGAPLALAVWTVLIPLVGLVGYMVTGLWVGEMILDREGTGRSRYGAAALGVLILMVVGLIPFVGALLGILTTIVGGGSIVLLAWRTFRGDRGAPVPAEAIAAP